jgi:hypothetical protein
VSSTVVTGPAEAAQLELDVPKPRPQQVSPWRAWARRDRQLYEALLAARETGKPQLEERARRAYVRNLATMPTSRRRRRGGGR